MNHSSFETLARKVFGQRLGVELWKVKLSGHPKTFDLVSMDGKILGDAKYLTMVRGKKTPPAKWSVIAEHVWLLEKTQAVVKFLVFGNDRRVISGWVERYGALVDSSIELYFMSNDGLVEEIDTRQSRGIRK